MFRSFFDAMDERQRAAALLVDEMYVQASVQYCGGEIYGYGLNAENELATTVLAVMVKSCFGGGKFLAKLIPVSTLDANFLFETVTSVISILTDCGGHVVALINDNNRVNQKYFTTFTPFSLPEKPWIVKNPHVPSEPMFLMYDPTHILKNIRNNWLTEPTRSLAYPVVGCAEKKIACWGNIEELFNHEQAQFFKLSKLTKCAVHPTNIQKQNVPFTLQVFCDETKSALKTSTHTSDYWKDTASFIELVVQLWKLWNTKSVFASKRFADPDRAVITLESIHGQEVLQRWVSIASEMAPSGATREPHTLTRDTAAALKWTCQCMLDLTDYLLNTPQPWKHAYVSLGFFQQDDLERHFGHFRLSAGSNYYLTAKEALCTAALDRARKFLKTADLDNIPSSMTRHKCLLCTEPLSDSDMYLLDEMAEETYINKVSTDEQNAIVYIAGYVAHKNKNDAGLSGNASDLNKEVTAFYDSQNRDGLTCPSSKFVNFALHCLWSLCPYCIPNGAGVR